MKQMHLLQKEATAKLQVVSPADTFNIWLLFKVKT